MAAIIPSSDTELLMYCVKRIETTKRNGMGSYGTGYFCNVDLAENTRTIVVITNKHVVNHAIELRINVHRIISQDADGRPIPSEHPEALILSRRNCTVVYHPRDDVDLAAILVQPALHEFAAANNGKQAYTPSLTSAQFVNDDDLGDLNAVEPILMVGCPNGLWDSKNGFPLFRRGFTATHPLVDYEGRPEIVLDVAVFGGSSGSPALLVRDGAFSNRAGNMYVVGQQQVRLLGTLWGGPRIDELGKVTAEQIPSEDAATGVAVTGVRMHLGFVIKAKENLVLFDAVRARVLELNGGRLPSPDASVEGGK